MRCWGIFGLIVIMVMGNAGYAQKGDREVPFTLADRDRLVRIETKIDQMEKRFVEFQESVDQRFVDFEKRMDQRFVEFERRMDQRFEQLEARIGQMMTFMWILATVFAGLVAAVIGITIWDRRTALAPALRRTDAVAERLDRIERALQALAERDPRVAEALHQAGLL